MHPSNRITLENLDSAVFWHKPSGDKPEKYEKIAHASKAFMQVILENAPDCADRSAALRCVREARMWANSSIALDNGEIDHTRA